LGETLQQSVSGNSGGQPLLSRFKDSPMPSPAASIASVNNALRRFRRNRRGSVAIEFAFVAPVFFVLLFAIIESAIVFLASQVLETGTQDSARLMYTHQAQDSAMTETMFKTDLCNRISMLFDCSGSNLANLYVDVKVFPPGTAISITDPIVSGNLTGPFLYQLPPVGASNTVVVRVFYKWQLFVTSLGFNFANLTGSQRLLAATAAFHVEP
jgi:Flp pilus assembly protein TadG